MQLLVSSEEFTNCCLNMLSFRILLFVSFVLTNLRPSSPFGNDFKPKYMSKIERSVSLFSHEGNLKTFQGFGKLSKLNTSKGQKFHTHVS